MRKVFNKLNVRYVLLLVVACAIIGVMFDISMFTPMNATAQNEQTDNSPPSDGGNNDDDDDDDDGEGYPGDGCEDDEENYCTCASRHWSPPNNEEYVDFTLGSLPTMKVTSDAGGNPCRIDPKTQKIPDITFTATVAGEADSTEVQENFGGIDCICHPERNFNRDFGEGKLTCQAYKRHNEADITWAVSGGTADTLSGPKIKVTPFGDKNITATACLQVEMKSFDCNADDAEAVDPALDIICDDITIECEITCEQCPPNSKNKNPGGTIALVYDGEKLKAEGEIKTCDALWKVEQGLGKISKNLAWGKKVEQAVKKIPLVNKMKDFSIEMSGKATLDVKCCDRHDEKSYHECAVEGEVKISGAVDDVLGGTANLLILVPRSFGITLPSAIVDGQLTMWGAGIKWEFFAGGKIGVDAFVSGGAEYKWSKDLENKKCEENCVTVKASGGVSLTPKIEFIGAIDLLWKYKPVFTGLAEASTGISGLGLGIDGELKIGICSGGGSLWVVTGPAFFFVKPPQMALGGDAVVLLDTYLPWPFEATYVLDEIEDTFNGLFKNLKVNYQLYDKCTLLRLLGEKCPKGSCGF